AVVRTSFRPSSLKDRASTPARVKSGTSAARMRPFGTAIVSGAAVIARMLTRTVSRSYRRPTGSARAAPDSLEAIKPPWRERARSNPRSRVALDPLAVGPERAEFLFHSLVAAIEVIDAKDVGLAFDCEQARDHERSARTKVGGHHLRAR